jgi:hypothetical protein
LILDGDPFTRQDGEWIHLECWRVGLTVDVFDMMQRARKLIARACQRLLGTPVLRSA